MTRSRGILLLVSAVVLVPLAIAGFASGGDPGADSFYKQFPVFQDVLRLVRQAYVDEVDLSELMAGAFQGLGDALDPFSTLVPGEQAGAVMSLGDAPPPSGMVLAHSNGVLFVVSVLPDGPAENADIRPGDVLTEIDGQPTRNLPLWNAELYLARVAEASDGELADGMSLGVLRRGDQWNTNLTSRLDESPAAELVMDGDIAILHLYGLEAAATDVVEAGLTREEIAGSAGLIVDLRRSWGTNYDTAVEIAGLLGVSGATDFVDRKGDRSSTASDREPAWHGPTVVLVGQGTHGAGELLARLLAERYATVGQNTFGYLGRTAWLPVGDGHQLRTADGFYAPPGEGTWDEPLEPEVLVTGRERRFSDKDQTLDELTRERGLEVLRSSGTARAA